MEYPPCFKAHYQVEIIPNYGVLLLTEDNQSSVVLRGKLYAMLATLMNGQYTREQIINELAQEFELSNIYYAYMCLEQRGYLTIPSQALPQNEQAFWSIQNIDPTKAATILQSTAVSIIAIGHVEIQKFQEKLLQLGIKSTDAKHSVLDVLVTDDYLQDALLKHNNKALQTKRPWLLLRPNGLQCWIGPLFIPEKTGCYRCLQKRLQHNEIEKYLLKQKNKTNSPPMTALAALPTTTDIAYSLAATEVAKYLANPTKNKLQNNVLSLDSRTWKSKYHSLLREAHCESCGEPPVTKSNVIELDNQKTLYYQGGYRTLSAKKTIKKLKHLISPITGIISGLDNYLDGRVYIAGHNMSLVSDIKFLFDKTNFRYYSGGKGFTSTQAKAGAICEAVERFAGVFRGTEPQIISSYQKLKNAIHPNNCMLFSISQYNTKNAEDAHSFNRIPLPFDEVTEISWTSMWSLTHKREMCLPTEYIYYNYHTLQQKKVLPTYCFADSNGNAAGHTLEEAILQGLLELIERDAVGIWWYNKLTMPQVDVNSFNESRFQLFLQYYNNELNRDVWVLDITNDLSIPCFVAISKEKSTQEYLCLGLGCHVNPTIAMERALSEMNQMLVSAQKIKSEHVLNIAGFSDGLSHWLTTAKLYDQSFLIPNADPMKKKVDYSLPTDNLFEVLNFCLNILKGKHMEVFVLDQTRSEIDLKVVKVIVPGLRHFWSRLAPGRLYDVPVQMGWLKKPLQEKELNPIPFFF